MRQAGSSTSLTSPNPYTCGVGFLIAHCRAEETISRRLRPFWFVFYFVYRIFKRTHLTRGQFLQDYSKESGSGETGLSPGRKSQLTSALRSCGFFGFAFSCLFAVSRRHTLPPLLSRNRHQGDRGQLLAPLGPKGVHKSSGHSGKAGRITERFPAGSRRYSSSRKPKGGIREPVIICPWFEPSLCTLLTRSRKGTGACHHIRLLRSATTTPPPCLALACHTMLTSKG